MADQIAIALRRNLARAEQIGNTVKAARIRRLLAERAASTSPVEAPAAVAGQEQGGSLDEVAFASQAARTAAEEAGMNAESFKRRRKSGESGFTKADVERIDAATDDGDEDDD